MSGMSQHDLWGIADQIEDLAGWEGWSPDSADEPPTDLLTDPDWVRSRLLALRFVLSEMDRESALYDLEIERLQHQREKVMEQLNQQDSRLRNQLGSYLLAVRADAEAQGRKAPASVKFPHGTIRSGGGSERIQLDDEAETLEWCRANLPNAVKVKETVLVSVLRSEMGVVDGMLWDPGTGEMVPGVSVVRGDRWVKIDTPTD